MRAVLLVKGPLLSEEEEGALASLKSEGIKFRVAQSRRASSRPGHLEPEALVFSAHEDLLVPYGKRGRLIEVAEYKIEKHGSWFYVVKDGERQSKALRRAEAEQLAEDLNGGMDRPEFDGSDPSGDSAD